MLNNTLNMQYNMLNRFLRWYDKVVEHQRKKKMEKSLTNCILGISNLWKRIKCK